MPFQLGRRINGKYKILRKLGSGAFGTVYEVEDRKGRKYAAKIETGRRGYLDEEYKVFKKMESKRRHYRGEVAVPRLKAFTKHGRYKVLIVELLGQDISNIWYGRRRTFSTKTFIMIAMQMLQRLQFLHYCGYVHNDLKPDNMMIGRHGSTRENIYMIDFGMAKKWRRKKEWARFVGTYQFSSMNACLGYRPSRADDVESLVYVMVYLFDKFTLPWFFQGNLRIIADMKRKISPSKLTKGMPKAFKYIHQDLKRLKYQDKPDCSKYRKWLEKELHRNGKKEDGKFDWL